MHKEEFSTRSTSNALHLILHGLITEKHLSKQTIKELLQQKPDDSIVFSLHLLLKQQEQETGKTREELLALLFAGEPTIPEKTVPADIFTSTVGSLETLVYYLKEQQHQNFNDIALILNRKLTTIRTAYTKAQEKGQQLPTTTTTITLPLTIFSDRRLTVFEAATKHLKDQGRTFVEIAVLLGKDQRNVWSTYHRALTKLSREETL